MSFDGASFHIGEGGFAGVGHLAPAGKPVAPRYRKCFIEIDGEHKVFTSVEDLIAYLESHKERIEEKAEKKAEKQARRILQAKGKVKPKEFKLRIDPKIAEEYPELAATVDEFERAYTRALGAILAREADEVEDIMEIAAIL